MGVDIYLRWEGFGEEKMDNPNYANQITGYQDSGKAGYLRISYGDKNYEELSSPFFWSWNLKKCFTKECIKKFEEIVNEMKVANKKEYLDFAELGKKLNKERKNPKVIISY